MPPPVNPVQDLLALHAAGRFAEMEKRARQALKANPGVAILDELLGIALMAQQRHTDALPHLEKAVRRESADAQFWENLGLCQRELDQSEEAEKSLRRSLALRANSPEALNALGSVLRSLGRIDEAQKMFERALVIEPRHLGALFNLGKMALEAGDWSTSEMAFGRALRLDPTHVQSQIALADLLFQRGRREEALQVADAVHRQLVGTGNIVVSAQNLKLLDGLAGVFVNLRQSTRALEIYQATHAFKPEPGRALAAMAVATTLCEWQFASALEPIALRAASDSTIDDILPWQFLSMASATAADQLALARNYAQRLLRKKRFDAPAKIAVGHKKTRLRLGYFSSDFLNHPVAYLISGVIEHHDRDRFEVVAYDLAPPTNDAYRSRLRSSFDRFVEMGDLSDVQIAARLREDEVDILIDLNGWTKGQRAGALVHRPASVQIQWLGYAGTTGAPWIDYVIADRIVIGSGEEVFFSEKVIRLPDTHQPNDDKRAVGPALARTAHGLPESGFVFCCFNQSHKITADVFDVWMRLLVGSERSVLWLSQSNDQSMAAFRARAVRAGVDPERLVVAPFVQSADDHFGRLSHADLALDCFPYGSHTTASDVLYVGVPLVALKGGTFASRVSASILTAAGLPELITTSLADYHDLALRLATDNDAFSMLRARVTKDVRKSALFDTLRFTANLEKGLLGAWERYAAGLPPASFDVG